MDEMTSADIQASETMAGDEAKGAARVARIYAEALMNVAENRDQADAIGDELHSLVHDLFQAEPKLEALLATPVIKRAKKEPLIRSAFEGKSSDLMLDFLLVLNKHDRLGLLRDLHFAYRELRDKRAKRLRVVVRSAVPLTLEQQADLKQTLEATTKLEPVLDLRIDPDLLGGMVVQVGDELFDNTVRTRIETLRNQLLARSSHEIQTGRDRFSSAT
jgi:F-type H+-transporting ATPase subunit delta